MKLTKHNLSGEITLQLNELEYTTILHALKAATADESRKGAEYLLFYGVEKGEIVSLHNALDEAERKA